MLVETDWSIQVRWFLDALTYKFRETIPIKKAQLFMFLGLINLDCASGNKVKYPNNVVSGCPYLQIQRNSSYKESTVTNVSRLDKFRLC